MHFPSPRLLCCCCFCCCFVLFLFLFSSARLVVAAFNTYIQAELKKVRLWVWLSITAAVDVTSLLRVDSLSPSKVSCLLVLLVLSSVSSLWIVDKVGKESVLWRWTGTLVETMFSCAVTKIVIGQEVDKVEDLTTFRMQKILFGIMLQMWMTLSWYDERDSCIDGCSCRTSIGRL